MRSSGTVLCLASACCFGAMAAFGKLAYDEGATVGTLLSPVRLVFDYEIRRGEEVDPLVTGRTMHAALNPHGRPCRLPERVKVLFA